MNQQYDRIEKDIALVNSIPAIASILEVVCRTTHMGFAAVARVTDDKWVACAVRDAINFGLQPGGELPIATTFCQDVRRNHQPVVIDDAATDDLYATHPSPLMYGFKSYISVPITLRSGVFFGTLCAIDRHSNQLNTPETIAMFNLFADLIAFHLHTVEQMERTETKLQEELTTADLRDQFIAILGHDLRSPVGAVANSAQLLQQMPLDADARRFVSIIQDATFRIKGLIENVLDFARGRLGGGITLNRTRCEPLAEILTEVITELRMVWPQRTFETHFSLTEQVDCDGKRIAQLFSNLLTNALKHGRADAPVRVEAVANKEAFTLTVANRGDRIPDAIMHRLFQPFSRGEVEPSQQGLGLGLYIAADIARAHGGEMEVSSTNEETVFTFRLPANPF